MKKISEVTVKEKLKNTKIEYCGGYVNSRTKAEFKCLKCNETWFALANNVLNKKSGCPRCSKRQKLNNQIFDKRNKSPIIRIGEIKGSLKNCQFKCKECNYLWETKPSYILNSNSGCPRCANTIKLSEKKLDKFLSQKNINRLECIGKNNKVKIKFKCLKCECIWKASPNNIMRGTGCPDCCGPKNEILTGKFIEKITGKKSKKLTIKNNIYNKKGEKIRNRIIVDHYFVWNNEQFIVEYNGIQHYEPYRYSKHKKIKIDSNIFDNQLIRDEFLRKYCQENKINLIEIDGRFIYNNKILSYLQEKLYV